MQSTKEEIQAQDIVYALATSPNFETDGICFAACYSGLYGSEDGGRTWQDAYAGLDLTEPLPTAAVAVSPNFEHDQTVFAGAPGGILRSLDGAETWDIATLPSPPPFVSTLAVSPNFARDGVVLAGTVEDGIFHSSDGGRHWTTWNFGLLDLNVLCLAVSPSFTEDETIFAGTDSGVFRSTNGGRAWREVDFSPDLAPVLSLAISPDYAVDGVLFAGTESHGLFTSEDQGTTWRRLGESVVVDAVNRIVLAPDLPSQPDLLVALGDALLVSRDAGDSWSSWETNSTFEEAIVSVAAPAGLDPGAPLLVGLADGTVLRIK